jgi:hypothetical protein
VALNFIGARTDGQKAISVGGLCWAWPLPFEEKEGEREKRECVREDPPLAGTQKKETSGAHKVVASHKNKSHPPRRAH